MYPCSLKAVMSGDRNTLAKLANPTPLIWASAFHVNGTPGLVTMAQENPGDEVILQVGWGGERELVGTGTDYQPPMPALLRS
jgi:hypothetical protein